MKYIFAIVILILFSAIPFSGNKKNDCPKISVEEQGQMLEQFFSDRDDNMKLLQDFKKSLKTYGYCPSQFGLK